MMIAVFALGLAVSGYVVFQDVYARLRPQPHVKPLTPEVHFVAAMISGAGAGLAWGSLWGLAAFVLQVAAGLFVSLRLRK